jgi:hypothetical protein
VLDTKWVFDLKINTTTRMIERFKTRIVANGQPQILGFDCHDVHAPTIPMPEIKLLLGISSCAHCDMELFQMDTTTAFISAARLSSLVNLFTAILHVDLRLGLGSNGLSGPACGNYRDELLLNLKALVLLQCAGLNPAVFQVPSSSKLWICSNRIWRCVLDHGIITVILQMICCSFQVATLMSMIFINQ